MPIIRIPPQEPVLAQNAQLNLGGIVSAANSAAAIGAAHAAAGRGLAEMAKETMAMFKPEKEETDIRHRELAFRREFAERSNQIYSNTVDANGNPVYDFTPQIEGLLGELGAKYGEGLTGEAQKAWNMKVETYTNQEVIQSINRSSQAQQGVAVQDTYQLIDEAINDFGTLQIPEELFERQLEEHYKVLGRNSIPASEIDKKRESDLQRAHEARINNVLNADQFDKAREYTKSSPYLSDLKKQDMLSIIDSRETTKTNQAKEAIKKQTDLIVKNIGQGSPVNDEMLKTVAEGGKALGLDEATIKRNVDTVKHMGEFAKLTPEQRQQWLNQMDAKAATGSAEEQALLNQYRDIHKDLAKMEMEDPVTYHNKRGLLDPKGSAPLNLNQNDPASIEAEFQRKADLGESLEHLKQQGKVSKNVPTTGLTASELAALADKLEKSDPQTFMSIIASINKVYGDKSMVIYKDMYENRSNVEQSVIALAGAMASKGGKGDVLAAAISGMNMIREGRIDKPTNKQLAVIQDALSRDPSFKNIDNPMFRQDLAYMLYAISAQQAASNEDPSVMLKFYKDLLTKMDVNINDIYKSLNPSSGYGPDPIFGSQEQIGNLSDGRNPADVLEQSSVQDLTALGFSQEMIDIIQSDEEYHIKQVAPDEYTITMMNPNGTVRLRERVSFKQAVPENTLSAKVPLGAPPMIADPTFSEKPVAAVSTASAKVASNLTMTQLNAMPTQDRLAHVWSLVQQAFPDNPAMQQVAMGMAINEVGLTQNSIGRLSTAMNSLFNIKDPKNGKVHGTIEYDSSGKAYSAPAEKWAHFNNLGESVEHFKGYVNRKLKNEQYGTVEQILAGIRRIGYATDPAYTDKVMAAINNHVKPLMKNGATATALYATEPTSKIALPAQIAITKNPAAVEASVNHYLSKVTNQDYYIYVDWNKPETEERLYVIDTRTGKTIAASRTAHGTGSGMGPIPTSFSNQVGSLNSPVGAMKIVADQSKSSKFNVSFRLEGMEKGINDNVSKRAVTLHSQPGIKSQGCFGIPENEINRILPYLKPGTLIYAQSNLAEIDTPDDYEAPTTQAKPAASVDTSTDKYSKNKDFFSDVDDIGEMLYSSAEKSVKGVPFNFTWRTDKRPGIDCIEGARRTVLHTMNQLPGYDMPKMERLLTGTTNEVYTKVSKLAGEISDADIRSGNVTPGTMLFVQRKEVPGWAKNRPNQISHSAVVISKNGELFVANQGGKAGTLVPYKQWLANQIGQKGSVARFYGTNPFLIK